MLKLVKILFVLSIFCTSSVRADVILVMGDSLSAAYGMEEEQGWVQLLTAKTPQHQWINASVSGETSGGAMDRLPRILERFQPDWVLIELGGNDGLRGYPLPELRENLTAMIRLARQAGARPLLMQMMIPPNYGERYTQAFSQLYEEIAKAENVPLIPFMLRDIALDQALMQDDGIHPTAEAQDRIARQIMADLLPLMDATPK